MRTSEFPTVMPKLAADDVALTAEPFTSETREEQSGPADRERSVDVWAGLLLLAAYGHRILAGSVIAALLAYLYALTLPNQYEALATVVLTPRTFSSELTPPAMSPIIVSKLAESDYILRLVRTQLAQQSGKDQALGTTSVVLYPTEDGTQSYVPMLGLRVRHTDPAAAQQVANAWALTIAKEASRLAGTAKDETAAFVVSQYKAAEGEVLQLEGEKKMADDRYERERGLLEAALNLDARRAQLEARTTEIKDLEGRLHQTRIEILDSGQQLTEVRQALQQTDQFVVVSKAISDDALWQQLSAEPDKGASALESSKLRTQEPNPVYVALKQQEAALRVRYNSRVPLEAPLGSQLGAKQEEAGSLRRRIIEGERRRDELKRAHENESAQLDRRLDSAKLRYEALRTKANAASVAVAEHPEDVRLTAPAELPTETAGPNRRLIALAGLTFGFFVSVLLAWVGLRLKGAYRRVSTEVARGQKPAVT